MNLSATVAISDLLPTKRTIKERVIDTLLDSDKRRLYRQVTLDNILPVLKKSGVNGIELMLSVYTTADDVMKAQEITHTYKLPIRSLHQPLGSFRYISTHDIERLCFYAKLINASVVVLHAEALGARMIDTEFQKELKMLQVKYQVFLGIENVPKTPFSRKLPYTWSSTEFSQVITQGNLSMTFDTTHLAQVGGDICEFFNKNKHAIVNIHLSDYKKHWVNTKVSLEKDTHLPLNSGELPIHQFLSILKKSKYQGLITMEINSGLPGLCSSAQLISRM